MNDEPKNLHVSATGENWEVESDSGTVAQAETKEEAIQAAKEAAPEAGAASILVHTSDGRIDEEITVRRPPADRKQEEGE